MGKYRGKADWDILSQVKQRFPDTIIFGSGDLMTPETIVERLQTSGLDGIIIARGAIGNPWIFTETRALLENKPKPAPPTLDEQREVMLHHFDMICQVKPPRKAIPFFRKFAVSYCKRHPQRKKVQLEIFDARTTNQLKETINKWYKP